MRVLMGAGSLRLAAALKAPAAVILGYHSVRASPEEEAVWIGPGITHSTKIFARHMELICRRFHPVSLDDILMFVKAGSKLPPRAVAVTFDDGFVDNFEMVAPLLARVGVPAAFYLTVGMIGTSDAPWYARIRHAFLTTPCKIWHSSGLNQLWDLSSWRDGALESAYASCASLTGGAQQRAVSLIEQELAVETLLPQRRTMMNWSEAKSLRKAGHIVGSHSLTHPNLAHVADDATLRSELVDSKRQMEKHLEEPVLHFSYPHPALNPQWSERTLAAKQEAGYASAITTTRRPVRPRANPLLLRRVRPIRPEHEFLWNLERAFLKD